MGFLPNGYKEPDAGGGRYFRIKDGENFKIRILGSFQDGTGIIGWQGWALDRDWETSHTLPF